MMPLAPTAMEGDTAPDHRIAEAPPPDLPVLKKVIVVPEPELDGKSIFAAGEIVPPDPEAVVQPVERATFTRA